MTPVQVFSPGIRPPIALTDKGYDSQAMPALPRKGARICAAPRLERGWSAVIFG